MGWEVYPAGHLSCIDENRRIQEYKEIIVTENGAAFHDIMQEGEVNDSERVLF
jgi:beta-glucosidase